MSTDSVLHNSPTLEVSPKLVAKIQHLATEGNFIGIVTEPVDLAGKKVFLPFVIPGELVEFTPIRDKKSFFEGELHQIKTPSPNRITPPCPYFGKCGGCDLQHIPLDQQRELKRSALEETLRVQAKHLPEERVTLLGVELNGLNYRRRMSFHLNRKGEFGLYRKNGRQIIPLDHCIISTSGINETLAKFLPAIRECGPEAETVTIEDHNGTIFLAFEVHPRSKDAAIALTKKDAFGTLVQALKNVQVNYRHKVVHRVVDGVPASDFAPPVGHFSQNNYGANNLMIEEIIKLLPDGPVTDLYAGAGNISIPIAKAGHDVHAVELDPYLVAFGKQQVKEQGLQDRVTFTMSGCEKWIIGAVPPKTIVLDPPRSGAFEVVKHLSPDKTELVIYVSCYPPTFVRDVGVLVERGYRFVSCKVLDMFPQTYHAEVIAVFARPHC